jgi:hypothetical protein
MAKPGGVAVKKHVIVLTMVAAVSASLAAGVMARPVGEIRFTIENGGQTPLQTFSLSRPHAHAWGQERLRGAVVAPGDRTEIVIQPSLGGCLYDMKAEFGSGGDARLFAVDVCQLNGAEIVLTD